MKFKMTPKSKRITIIVGAMFGLATLSFNCAPNMFESAKYLNATSSSSSSSSANPFAPTDAPYSQMVSNQTFQSMLNVTNQAGSMTATQKAEYNLRTGALAGGNSLMTINGPMMIGTTSLAGEVCNGLLANEMPMPDASRTFFQGVDFTKGPVSTSQLQFLNVSAVMAVQFYARALSADESQILASYYASFIADSSVSMASAAQTKVLYLGLCASMLSSFDSMTY